MPSINAYPGAVGVDLGTPVAVTEATVIEATMHGALVEITKAPAGYGVRWSSGALLEYIGIGWLAFGDGEFWERPQGFGWINQSYCARTFIVPTHLLITPNPGVELTVTPWTIKGAPDPPGRLFVPLQSPLTSTSFDGDAFSTTAITMLGLQTLFGVPAGVWAVLLSITINDCKITFCPVSTVGIFNAFHVACGGLANDAYARGQGIVPCDHNNTDSVIYYSIDASGTLTMDVRIRIWGYWI
jgi:hypothetical protein